MPEKYAEYLVDGKSSFFNDCLGKVYIIVKQQSDEVIVNIDSYFEANIIKNKV